MDPDQDPEAPAPVKRQSRYASIDFLRGLAIVMMLVLHIISDTLDVEGLLANPGNLALVELLMAILLPFLGGLAGFFLMVSAIGNMLSMYRYLQKGKSVRALAQRQVLGGILLLIFAMLTEAVIGYHGAFGNIFKTLDDPSQWDWSPVLWRWYYFETIHTIAWCVILNGVVQAILSRNAGWKDPRKLIRTYAILAVATLAVTPLAWLLARLVEPGFPWATDPLTGRNVQFAVLGESPVGDVILRFFLSAIAGEWEPIFPYLATSFVGSIIGIHLAQPPETSKMSETPERASRTFPGRWARVGFVAFAVGTIGIVVNLVLMMESAGFDAALDAYMSIPNHRAWVPARGVPVAGWLFQWLSLNGLALCFVCVVLRVVEFRGKGQAFAEKTTFIRRFGFVAFTIYAGQWLYFVVHFLVSSLLGTPYLRLQWGGSLLVVGVTLAAFHGVLRLWEKVKYTGSLEWCLASLAAVLIPARKQASKADRASPGEPDLPPTRWWQRGQLNVAGAFYHARWLDVVESPEGPAARAADSRLAAKLAWFGFFFPPLAFVSYCLAQRVGATGDSNAHARRVRVLSLAGIVFFFAWIVALSILTPVLLGVDLGL